MRARYLDVRKEIDRTKGSVVDASSIDPMELALLARDMYDSDQPDVAKKILASIPPVILGKTKYRVVAGGRHGLDLLGPRGGHSSLVQNINDKKMYAHNTMSGYNVKTTWYRQRPDFTFEMVR